MAGKFSIEAIFKARDDATAIVGKIEKRFDHFNKSIASKLSSLNSSISTVMGGLTMAGGALAAVGAAGGAAFLNVAKAGADFEEAITAVGAVSLMTRDQIADLEKKALELGATTKFSATEVANAMELMGRAGFTNTEVLQGIGGILSAAAAEGAEVADVAGHVSNVLKGMGLATTEATRVADVLTLASARTNSSITSLGESMSNVASTARQFNIPLEDSVAAVALLQDVGLDASVAGSALNTMLTKLADPTDDVAAKMRKFGVTFQDAKGNMLPFAQVMENMAKAAEKSGGNMDQVAFFADLVGLRGQKAAANLKDLFTSGKFSSLAAELRNAKGSAEKMAALRMNNLKGDMEQLGGAVDSVKIALFNTQSGPLRAIVQRVTEWIQKNQDLIKSRFVEYLQKIIDNLPLIITWIKRVAIGVGVFLAVAAAVKVATVAFAAYELAVSAVTLVTSGFGLAIRAAMGVLALYNAVVNSARFAAIANTVATVASTVAEKARAIALAIGAAGTTRLTATMVAGTVATWAKNAATVAYNLALRLGATLTALFSLATVRDVAFLGTSTIATWAKTAALGAYSLASQGAAAATALASASMAPFLITIAAATAAVLALIAAWDQWNKLNKETEGLGLTGIASGMIEKGTLDPFEVVNDHQNKLARERRAAQNPQAVNTTAAAVSKSVQESNATLTIKDQTGRAELSKPKGSGGGIKLQPSGAF